MKALSQDIPSQNRAGINNNRSDQARDVSPVGAVASNLGVPLLLSVGLVMFEVF